MEDMYLPHRQRLQGHGPNSAPNASVPNHQLPANPSLSDIHGLPHVSQPPPQATSMSREPSSQHPLQQQVSMPASEAPGAQSNTAQAFSIPEEQVEKITHSFDNHGRPVANREGESQSRQVIVQDPDSWNFEEPTTSLGGLAPDVNPSRRPDTDAFPAANSIPAKSPPRMGSQSHRRKSSGSVNMSRRKLEGHESRESVLNQGARSDLQNFKVRFALRGHLDVVRSVIFTGGGSPSEPEICTAGDDGMIKRWIIPASYTTQHGMSNDLDKTCYFTHRGHDGAVTSLAACPATASFSTGGRVSGDGWIFSGGQDSTIRVWERGRVDPKATLDGHTDAVWAVCVLPTTCSSVFGQDSSTYGGPDRILLASGSADGTIKIWAVSAPPQIISPQTGSRRGVGGSRRHSVTSGSNYPSDPQPSVATSTPFNYTLIHTIERATHPSPTCISPLSLTGENFVVSFSDASILVFDTRTGEEIIGMASAETYDGTPATGVLSVVATSVGVEGAMGMDSGRGASEDESVVHGATGSSVGGGVEGVVISGHEDRFIRFFDANSGQCTYSMLAHPSAVSSLSLSKDGREAVSAGHDASIRFWSLEKRLCTQEITSHRIMRGEGVCSVVWSQDGRLVVSAGGDGIVKVFSR
jgi:striatin 1/3/4